MESDGPESGSSKKAIRGEVIEDSNTCKNEPELQSLKWVQTGVGDLWAWNVTPCLRLWLETCAAQGSRNRPFWLRG